MGLLLLAVQLAMLAPSGLRISSNPGPPCVLVTQYKSTRIYETRLFHIYDPGRAQIDFPADSRVIRTRFSVVVIPPGESPWFFSSKAVIMHPAADTQYSYAYAGQQPPCPVKRK